MSADIWRLRRTDFTRQITPSAAVTFSRGTVTVTVTVTARSHPLLSINTSGRYKSLVRVRLRELRLIPAFAKIHTSYLTV